MSGSESSEVVACLESIAAGMNGLKSLGLSVKAKHDTVYTEAGLVIELKGTGWVPRLFVTPPGLTERNVSLEDLDDF